MRLIVHTLVVASSAEAQAIDPSAGPFGLFPTFPSQVFAQMEMARLFACLTGCRMEQMLGDLRPLREWNPRPQFNAFLYRFPDITVPQLAALTIDEAADLASRWAASGELAWHGLTAPTLRNRLLEIRTASRLALDTSRWVFLWEHSDFGSGKT